MKPLLLTHRAASIKKEIGIVLTILAIIIFLPIIAFIITLHGSILALSSESSSYLYQGPLSTTDTYAWGNCTYWAALLRQQAGDPIPNSWGNANTWVINAQLDGYKVDHIPMPTAIMQTTTGGLGHVAYVESVDPTSGAWTISEMNVIGLDVVDTKTLAASDAKNFNFIHDKTTQI